MVRTYRRFSWVAPAFALAIAACGQTPAAAPAPAPVAEASGPHIWFICDGIDAPVVFVATERDAQGKITLTQYDKPNGSKAWERSYALGEADPGAGQIYYALKDDAGADAGNVHAINDGVLEDPTAAYTTPITSVTLGEQRVSCRWLERTRVLGFTGRRSVVVSEDADGDLIYRSFNFDAPDGARAIELGGAQRTTRFSTEARGGTEETGPAGAIFRFEKDGYRYVVGVPETGEATVAVFEGEQVRQTEHMLAHQTPPRNE